ncbi:hypothetical protein FHT86_006969 [Rhizobium sp. BK313]|uniref:hypothetical protein n=1 Tax=Rhizobium sp. BK313 TaxID=2587081 RepID=UPI0010DD1216|nr:hypothetical protein [Rhizobium sp. BK313]MBB3458643.1 hypothetical protein [Rhizobium sp. BK313]
MGRKEFYSKHSWVALKSPMAHPRFDVDKDQWGNGWSVYDIFTGVTVVLDGQELSALDREDADELCDLLNLEDCLRNAKVTLQ